MSDRAITITAGILIFIIIGGLLFRSIPESTGVASRGGVEAELAITPKTISRVIARVEDCSQVGQRTRLKGYVVNTGNSTLSLVTVQSIWKNSAGFILARGLVYVVSREQPLEPGERRDFDDVTKLSNVRKCNVEPLDWGA
jgi:hypothetical protein